MCNSNKIYWLKCNHYTPNQHQQHKWVTPVRRLTDKQLDNWRRAHSNILRNETHPLQRANYQSQPLCSQKEMTSAIHVIWSACQGKSAWYKFKCKHPLSSRKKERVQSEIWPQLPNNPYCKLLNVILGDISPFSSIATFSRALGLFGICRFPPNRRDSRACLSCSAPS